MGLSFSKDLFLISEEIYPNSRSDRPVSKIQQKILKKYGPNAVPFTFTIGSNTPQTVIIQPGLTDKGQPCGVRYSVRVFPADDDKKLKANRAWVCLRSSSLFFWFIRYPMIRNSVSMRIRKIEVAPHGKGRVPSCIIRKDFLLSPGELELEATLNKPLYIYGEPIGVNLSVRNYSNKSVKRIVILGEQLVSDRD